VIKGTIFATFCAILVKIGSLTPKTRLQFDDHRSFGTLAFRNGS